jgi:Domain of unknown function (DUF4440)
MDDPATLTALNERFVDAFRKGSWELLEPILSPGFSYLDGATGEVWPMDRYIADLEGNPQPTIQIDRVRIHVHGDTAVVSARSSTHPDRFNCYLDTYVRRGDRWLCVHACVWPLRELVMKGDHQ